MSTWGQTIVISRTDPCALAFGHVPGRTAENKFGFNLAVGASYETIWSVGGAYPFLAAASQIRVRAGGNVADTLLGNNARTLTVFGIDGTGALIDESIDLAGASASAATTATFLRVNRAFVTEVGVAGNSNAGNITIETTGGTALAQIPALLGQTQQCVLSTPTTQNIALTGLELTTDGNGVDARLVIREDYLDTTLQPLRVIRSYFGATSVNVQFTPEIVLGLRTDVYVEAVRAGGADSQLGASFGYYTERI